MPNNKENKKLTVYYLDANAQVYKEPETQADYEEQTEVQQQESSTEVNQQQDPQQQQAIHP